MIFTMHVSLFFLFFIELVIGNQGDIFDPLSRKCEPASQVFGCTPPTTPSCLEGQKTPLGACSNKFLQCSNGQQVKKQCPQGTVFDPLGLKCSPPSQVFSCTQPTTPKFTTPKCMEGQKTPLDICSNEYLECVNGEEVQKQCPQGTVFDPLKYSCLPPNQVFSCTKPTTPTFAPPTTPACMEGQKTPLRLCDKDYLECVDGKQVHKECPQGTVIDPMSLKCLPPRQVFGCSQPTTPSCVEGQKTPLDACSDQYLECDNGEEVKKRCPHGTVFDPLYRKCSLPSQVFGCSKPTTPACMEGQKTPLDACINEYVECVNGEQIKKQCPQGTVFDPLYRKCSPPSQVFGCSKPTTPKCMAGQKTPVDMCSDEYVECDNGELVKKHCPQGTIFDPLRSKCLPPSQVFGCTQPTTPKCMEGQKTPVDMCSDEYVECVDGELVKKHCPQGTIFDPMYRKCSPPSQVFGCTQPTTPACMEGQKTPLEACSDEYLECDNGQEVKKRCAQGTVFDPMRFQCSPPSQVFGCSKPTTPACQEGLKWPKDQCSPEYFECVNGKVVTRSC